LHTGGEVELLLLLPDAATPINMTAAAPPAIQPQVPAEIPEEVLVPPASPALPAPSGFFGHVSQVEEPAGASAASNVGSAASAPEIAPGPNDRKQTNESNATNAFIGERNRRLVIINPF
jgi:hypothetical protein